jgi:dTDP-glucose 4,6-dehydratase
MRLLVTGGAGFIGSNFIHYLLDQFPSAQVVNLDALTYAGNPDNLRDVEAHPRYTFVQGRVEDRTLVERLMTDVDSVIHFAAESHVDRSIADATPFLTTNVLGTHVLLEAARKTGIQRLLHVSTDEVYGSLGAEGFSTEESPLRPRSPYAASKAGADHLALAYAHTYNLPVVVVRLSNNYGPYQYPEKFLPLLITNALQGEALPIYGDGQNVREWLHVEDACRALARLLQDGKPGEAYNVGGGKGYPNLEVARMVLQVMGRPESLITFVADRPGHDFRYALDCAKIQRELGWTPTIAFADGLHSVIAWYREHGPWWMQLKTRLGRATRGYWT